MPRFQRLVIPGMPHHIVQRGNRRVDVFVDDSDRQVFLRMLSQVSEQYRLANVGYSLMTNHQHLVSIPQNENSLALAMRDLLGPYASYFNKKYGLSGRLWQGRFYSVVLDEPHFWAALRYVERNPVRAGLVRKAEDYRWSSAPAHCGLFEDPFLAPLPAGAPSLTEWSAWLAESETQSQVERIRRCTKTGRPCGSDAFLRELERCTGRVLLPRKLGRPSNQRPAPVDAWFELEDPIKK
jgi:putative transposase